MWNMRCPGASSQCLKWERHFVDLALQPQTDSKQRSLLTKPTQHSTQGTPLSLCTTHAPTCGAMASNSSKKSRQGAAAAARWNTSRTAASEAPMYLLSSSGPLHVRGRVQGDGREWYAVKGEVV
jgi:hypothetical protein